MRQLVARKRSAREKEGLDESEVARWSPRFDELVAQLEAERDRSELPERPVCIPELERVVASARRAPRQCT
ncbi:MAG: hypothetical protein R3F34_04390 [Planctomycetota bacterium]